MRWIILLLAGFKIALPGHAAAGQVVYDCSIRSNERYGWIPPRMTFVVDEATNSVSVYDPIIDHVHGAPVAAQVTSVSGGRYKLKWTLQNLPGRTRSTKGQYSATLDTGKSYVRTRATLSGFANRPSGQGACAVSRR